MLEMNDGMKFNMEKTLAQQAMKEKSRIEDEVKKTYPSVQFGSVHNSPALEQYLEKVYPRLLQSAIGNYGHTIQSMETGMGTFGEVFHSALNGAPDPYEGLPQQDPNYTGNDKKSPMRDILWSAMSRWVVVNQQNFQRLHKINKAIDLFIATQRNKQSMKEGRETERGKPLSRTGYSEQYVIIYRAMLATETELKDNDYVTRSKQFAIEHSDHQTSVHEELYHVMRFIVKPDHVFETLNLNTGEYFYYGPPVKGKEIYNSKAFL
jgi:hypothetical protein